MNWGLIISGVLVGFMFGFVLQRGRFCMNTAFREVLLSRDFTVFRAYILALVVLIIGANVLEYLGIIHLRAIPFTWMANVLGGYIFGIGMVLGGGCATGTLYRIGEGMVGSWFAALGFMLAAAAVLSGFLRPVAEFIWYGTESFPFVYMPEEGNIVTLYSILGINKWLIIVLLVIPALIFVSKGKFKKPEAQKGFVWWTTAIMIGLIATAAFYASEVYGGFSEARGLSFTGPLKEFVTWMTDIGTAEKFRAIALDEDIELAGSMARAGTMTWSVWMIIGLVLGSMTSAWSGKEFGWRAPKAPQLVTQFGGGLLMGFGGALAGGCNIGHGLTGFSTLALGSLVSLIFIILGSWTMVYFLFIRE